LVVVVRTIEPISGRAAADFLLILLQSSSTVDLVGFPIALATSPEWALRLFAGNLFA